MWDRCSMPVWNLNSIFNSSFQDLRFDVFEVFLKVIRKATFLVAAALFGFVLLWVLVEDVLKKAWPLRSPVLFPVCKLVHFDKIFATLEARGSIQQVARVQLFRLLGWRFRLCDLDCLLLGIEDILIVVVDLDLTVTIRSENVSTRNGSAY